MLTITSRRNPVCIHIKKLGTSNNYRKQTGEFLCDGIKLLEEAIKCGVKIPIVLTCDSIDFPLSIDTKLYYTDLSLINSISSLRETQGVLFTCKTPIIPSIADITGTHILLDGLQDPGNIGTIIRTAYAFGIKSVMLFGDSADPYNPKTVRGSMGAIFRQEIRNVTIDDLNCYKRNQMKIIGAALSNDCRDFTETSYNNSVIAIGNEGRGLSEEIISICDEKIKIPISKECQSLNAAVAAAIIMWKAGKE